MQELHFRIINIILFINQYFLKELVLNFQQIYHNDQLLNNLKNYNLIISIINLLHTY